MILRGMEGVAQMGLVVEAEDPPGAPSPALDRLVRLGLDVDAASVSRDCAQVCNSLREPSLPLFGRGLSA